MTYHAHNTRPAPVSSEDNREVFGLALCDVELFSSTLDAVEQLRQRQAAYIASLPTDPVECARQARKLLGDDFPYPEPLDDATHMARALRSMVSESDDHERRRESMAYVCDQLLRSLERLRRNLDVVNDLMANATGMVRR